MSARESVRRRDIAMATVVVVLAALAVLVGQGPVRGSSSTSPELAGRGVRKDPRFDRLVPRGASLEKIAGGFAWVEGPVWDRARGALLVSDIPRNSVIERQPGYRIALSTRGLGF